MKITTKEIKTILSISKGEILLIEGQYDLETCLSNCISIYNNENQNNPLKVFCKNYDVYKFLCSVLIFTHFLSSIYSSTVTVVEFSCSALEIQ